MDAALWWPSTASVRTFQFPFARENPPEGGFTSKRSSRERRGKIEINLSSSSFFFYFKRSVRWMQSIWNGRLGVEPLCRLDSQCCVSSVSFCLVLFACSISCLIVRINGVHSPPPGRMLLLPAGAVGPLLLLLRMKKKRQAPAYDCWLIWSQDWAHRRGCDIGSCVRLSVIAAVARHKDKRNVSTCSSCSVERVGSGICSFFFLFRLRLKRPEHHP